MRLPQDRILHIDTEFKDGKVNIVAEWQGELVRCKDCKHRDLFSCPLADNDFQKDEDFCSWGERRKAVNRMSDLISRQGALAKIRTRLQDWAAYGNEEYRRGLYACEDMILSLPSAEPNKELKGSDLIRREDAIEALGEEPEVWTDTEEEWAYRNAWVEHISAIKSLPSAPDSRQRGEWVIHDEVKNIYGGIYIECSECGTKFVTQTLEDERFCRNCGARMLGEDGEDE